MKKTEIDLKAGVITAWEIDELDLNKGIDSQCHLLKEDLIQVQFGRDLVLDLGWYPKFDPQGRFVINVVLGQDWQKPIVQFEFRDLGQLELMLERAIEVANSYHSA
jgi:hypothetical protein